MKNDFPEIIKKFEKFSDRFDAYRLSTNEVDIYFASYPKDTKIDSHNHDTENYGFITKGELILEVDGKQSNYKTGEWYHIPAGKNHSARFEIDTQEIELWFK